MLTPALWGNFLCMVKLHGQTPSAWSSRFPAETILNSQPNPRNREPPGIQGGSRFRVHGQTFNGQTRCIQGLMTYTLNPKKITLEMRTRRNLLAHSLPAHRAGGAPLPGIPVPPVGVGGEAEDSGFKVTGLREHED